MYRLSDVIYTVELSDINRSRVEEYVQRLGLPWRLFQHDPEYSVCIVSCNREQAVWLELLA
jgi:hypothetical protein